MPNLFLGFPVPRAKIADMIAGSAPPSLHKTQHQAGGADQIDCTGLTGAGGAAFPIRGLWTDDHDADATRWRKTFTGSGALTRAYEKLVLKTGSTNPSIAQIYRHLQQPIPTLTWAKKRHLVFGAYLDCDDTATAIIHILSGWYTAANHIGFEISGGKLWGINANAGAQTKTEIKTFVGAFIGEDILLEAIFYPGVKVEFYVNGVLEQTSTTNLPTGTGSADSLLQLKCDNNSTTNNVELDFDQIQLYQEA